MKRLRQIAFDLFMTGCVCLAVLLVLYAILSVAALIVAGTTALAGK